MSRSFHHAYIGGFHPSDIDEVLSVIEGHARSICRLSIVKFPQRIDLALEDSGVERSIEGMEAFLSLVEGPPCNRGAWSVLPSLGDPPTEGLFRCLTMIWRYMIFSHNFYVCLTDEVMLGQSLIMLYAGQPIPPAMERWRPNSDSPEVANRDGHWKKFEFFEFDAYLRIRCKLNKLYNAYWFTGQLSQKEYQEFESLREQNSPELNSRMDGVIARLGL